VTWRNFKLPFTGARRVSCAIYTRLMAPDLRGKGELGSSEENIPYFIIAQGGGGTYHRSATYAVQDARAR